MPRLRSPLERALASLVSISILCVCFLCFSVNTHCSLFASAESFASDPRSLSYMRHRALARHFHFLDAQLRPLVLKSMVSTKDEEYECQNEGQVVYVAPPTYGNFSSPVEDAYADSHVNCSTTRPHACQHNCTRDDIMSLNGRLFKRDELRAKVITFLESLQIKVRTSIETIAPESCGGIDLSGQAFSSNALVFLTSRPENTALMYSIDTVPCLVEEGSERPLVVRVNLAPSLYDSYNSPTTVLVVARAVLQALAFNFDAAENFMLGAKTYKEADPASYPTGPIRVEGSRKNISGGVGSNDAPANGTSHTDILDGSYYVVTPRVLEALKKHVACENVTAIPLDIVIPGLERVMFLSLHWARTSLLTVEAPATPLQLFVSPLELSLLKDTGWYDVDVDVAADERFRWGFHQGCSFLTENCSTGSAPEEYKCDSFYDNITFPEGSCSFDRTFAGQCHPIERIWFEKIIGVSEEWGDSATMCPVASPRTSFGSNGYCTSDLSLGSNSTAVNLNLVGRYSRCFLASTAGAQEGAGDKLPPSHRPVIPFCFPMACSENLSTILILVGNQTVQCAQGGKKGFRFTPMYGTGEDAYNLSLLSNKTVAQSDVTGGGGGGRYPMIWSPEELQQFQLIQTASIDGVLPCPDSFESICSQPFALRLTPEQIPTLNQISLFNISSESMADISGEGMALQNCTQIRFATVPSRILTTSSTIVSSVPNLTSILARQLLSPQAVRESLSVKIDVEVWCPLKGLCPDEEHACGASRLYQALQVFPPCRMYNGDEGMCSSRRQTCRWFVLLRLCLELNDKSFYTAPPETTAPSDLFAEGCSRSFPFRCNGTTTVCTRDPSMCYKCDPESVSCWNSECWPSIAYCSCPPTHSVRCAFDPARTCVSNAAYCPSDACSSYMFQCWNHACVDEVGQCPCPYGTPYKCISSNFTVNNTLVMKFPNWYTEANINAFQPGLHDRTCTATKEECVDDPCSEETPVRCWDNKCVSQLTECPCPMIKPYRCWTRECAISEDDCPCRVETPYTCNTTATNSQGGAAVALLPEGECVANTSQCFSGFVPPTCSKDDFRCETLACAFSEYDCPCSEMPPANKTIIRPLEMRIRMADKTVLYNEWTEVPAEIEFSPCNVDRSMMVSYQWYIAEVGMLAPIILRSSLITHRTLEIPPWELTPGRRYRLEVRATVRQGEEGSVITLPGSSAPNETTGTTSSPPAPNDEGANLITANRSIEFFAVSPTPSVEIVGGHRDIPNARPLILYALVKDAEVRSQSIIWNCCPAQMDWATLNAVCLKGKQCPPNFSYIVNLHTSEVTLDTTGSVGLFEFEAVYRDAEPSRVRISLLEGEVPWCELYVATPRAFIDTNGYVGVIAEVNIVDDRTDVSVKWQVNETTLSAQTGRVVKLAAGFSNGSNAETGSIPRGYESTVTMVVQTARDDTMKCSLTVVPKAPLPLSHCTLRNVDVTERLTDFDTNRGTEGYSRMEFSIYGAESLYFSDHPLYRFGYFDSDSRPHFLSTHWSSQPQHFFRLPVVTRNPSIRTVIFFASAVRKDDPSYLADTVNCTADIKTQELRTATSFANKYLAQMYMSIGAGDLHSALLAALQTAIMLDDPEIAALSRISFAHQLIQVLTNATDRTKLWILSPTLSSICIDILHLIRNYISPDRMDNVFSIIDAFLVDYGSMGLDMDRDGHTVQELLSWSHSDINSTELYIRYAKLSTKAAALESLVSATISAKQEGKQISTQAIRILSTQLGGRTIGSAPVISFSSDVFIPQQSIAASAQLVSIQYSGYFPVTTDIGLWQNVSGVNGTTIVTGSQCSDVVWVGVRLEEEGMDYLSSMTAFNITFPLHFPQDSLTIAERNLTCLALDQKENRWVIVGSAMVSPSEVSPTSTTYLGICAVKNLTFVVIFDIQWVIERVSTEPPKRTSIVSALTNRLSPAVVGAIAFCGLIILSAVACVLFAIRRRRKKKEIREKEREETEQMLDISRLIDRDDDLQRTIELARLKFLYGDDI